MYFSALGKAYFPVLSNHFSIKELCFMAGENYIYESISIHLCVSLAHVQVISVQFMCTYLCVLYIYISIYVCINVYVYL